jgi:hypothetical protein
LEGLKCENVDIFYAHPEYFTRIWDILWTFGTFCVMYFGAFFPVLVPCTKKNQVTLADNIWCNRIRTQVAFYFMPAVQHYYKHKCELQWQPIQCSENLTCQCLSVLLGTGPISFRSVWWS